MPNNDTRSEWPFILNEIEVKSRFLLARSTQFVVMTYKPKDLFEEYYTLPRDRSLEETQGYDHEWL